MASAAAPPRIHSKKVIEYSHATILVPRAEKPIFELSNVEEFNGNINDDFINKALIPNDQSNTEYRVVVVKHKDKYYLKTLDDQRVFEMPASGRIDNLDYPSGKELVLIQYEATMFDDTHSCSEFKSTNLDTFKKSFEIKKYLYLYFNEVNNTIRAEKINTQITKIPNYLFVPFYNDNGDLTILLYNNLTNKFSDTKITSLKNQNAGKIKDYICFKYKLNNEINKKISLYRFSSIVGSCIPPAYFYYKQKIGDTEPKQKEYIHELTDLEIQHDCFDPNQDKQGGGSLFKKSRKTQKRNKKPSKTNIRRLYKTVVLTGVS